MYAKYINFSSGKLVNLKIEESDFSESTFSRLDLTNLELNNVKLHSTEFIRTNLKDTDFSTCDITNILFDQTSLKGIVIDGFQAMNIASLFGVKIKN